MNLRIKFLIASMLCGVALGTAAQDTAIPKHLQLARDFVTNTKQENNEYSNTQVLVRMPGEKGVQLLERARQLRPRLVRMMITAYADYDVTVEAVNLGSIFRYISKPIQMDDVRNTLHRAMEF